METVHILGTYINGQRCRFLHECSNDEFNSIMESIDWTMPEGYWWWHLLEGEDKDNSERVRRIGQLGYVVEYNQTPAKPSEWITKARAEDLQGIPNRHTPNRQYRLVIYNGKWGAPLLNNIVENAYYGSKLSADSAMTDIAAVEALNNKTVEPIEFPKHMQDDHTGFRTTDKSNGNLQDYVMIRNWE